MQGNYRFRMLILGVTAALASCLIALALAAPPAQASHQPADLSISQTDGPDPLEAGYLTYTLTVKHEPGCSGDACSSYSDAMQVTDTLPAGVTLMDLNHPSTTSDGYRVSCTGTSTITCTIGNLYVGESVDIDIVVRPTTAGTQTLTNTATVSRMYGYTDPNATNNSSTATTQVGESYTPPSGCASMSECPNTTLTQAPESFSTDVSPNFSFTSSEANSTFECKLDSGAFQACPSPKQYFVLPEGQHTFQVRAKNAGGNVDPIPAQHTWTVDSLSPKITYTEKPNAVTNDRTPTWAWNIADANPDPAEDSCYLYDDTNERYILNYFSCASSSPYTFGGELPDGEYYFDISTEDKAGNYDSAYKYFEVDTVAPTVVSATPTGRLVRPSADVLVTFDDAIYDSARFVNIYKSGSSTPLAVYRYTYNGDNEIEIDPKSYLKRDTRYTVKVTTGVNDGANNLEAPKTWNFKTK